jgi:hypothetical protein
MVGKLEGKITLGKATRWWVDDIKMDIVEIGCGCVG